MKRISLAISLVLLGTMSVSAADLAARPYTKAPPPVVAVYNWTGFYIGLNAGYHDIDMGRYSAVPADADTAAFFWTNNPCFAAGFCNPNRGGSSNGGFIGGGQIGYNWQASNFVFGLEADIQGSSAGATDRLFWNQAPFPAGTTYTSEATTKMDWLATFRARAGVLVTPQTLLYITGGGAVAEVNRSWSQQYDVGDVTAGRTAGSDSSTNWGWTVGAGVEWAAFANWTLGAEYLFVRLEGNTFRGAVAGGVLSTPANSNFIVTAGDFDNHIARVKLNYKFGGPVVAKY
jgi:outer membrane immunogenic protein